MGGELAGARVRVNRETERALPGIEEAQFAPSAAIHRTLSEAVAPHGSFEDLVSFRKASIARELGAALSEGSVIRRIGNSLAAELRGELAEAALPRLRSARNDPAELRSDSLLAQTLSRIDEDLFRGNGENENVPGGWQPGRSVETKQLLPPDTVDACVLKGDPTGQDPRTIERAVEVASRHALYKLAKFQSLRPLEEITGALELISRAPELRDVDLSACGIGSILDVMATIEASRRLEPRNHQFSEPARKLDRIMREVLPRLLTVQEHECGLKKSDEET